MFWRAWEKADRKNGTEMNSQQHIEMKQSSAVYTQRQMTIIKAVQRIAQAELNRKRSKKREKNRTNLHIYIWVCW